MAYNQDINTSKFLKSISPVLSNSAFNRVINDDFNFIKNRATKYLNQNSEICLNTYEDFFEHLYTSMLKNYRSEFVYKNEIINKILLGKYSLNTTTVLNEFKIGKSIADLVLLNGTSVVYEIKTEYDSPERLLNQICEYRKSFLNIVIVTHHSVTDKYKDFLKKNQLNNVGLLMLTERNTLTEKLKCKEDINFLETSYLFKCLRKNEYCNLIKKYFGYLPNVPNTKLFKECLNMAMRIDKKEFHDLVFYQLKKRKINEKKIISSTETPYFLKHILISLNLKKRDLEKINLFLLQNL